jgi:REP element-mobilizing transposase RayT
VFTARAAASSVFPDVLSLTRKRHVLSGSLTSPAMATNHVRERQATRAFPLSHGVYALHYHLVIGTKSRRKCITAPMRDRLHKISAQRCKDWRGTLIAFNGEADHVQLLISLPPESPLRRSKAVRSRKRLRIAAELTLLAMTDALAGRTHDARLFGSTAPRLRDQPL